MEDFLIFLIGIIYVGYRFYSKNLKNKENAKPVNTAPSGSEYYHEEDEEFYNEPQKNVNDYIKDFFNQEISSEDDYKYEDSIEEEISTNNTYNYKNIDNVVAEEGKSDIPNKDLTEFYTRDQVEKSDLLKDFDLRKAVIYNEILKRKYF